VKIRGQFKDHLARVFRLLGDDPKAAGSAAERLMKLETSLAAASRKREDTRDPFQNYHKMAFAGLDRAAPDFDWALFMKTAGLAGVDTVIVGQPEFLTALNGLLRTVPLEDWKRYLKYHLVRGLAGYLDDGTYREFFGFYSTALRGVQEPKPRWKRTVEQTNRSLGELVGQVYVKRYLPKGAKPKLLEIGNAIRSVYAERIRGLDWMSEPTKEKALKKLAAITMKLGYPDRWKDLSNLAVDRTSYVRNGMAANRWQFEYDAAKFGKPVDRNEWGMEPQTNNAYYNPSNNEIVIPGCWINLPGYERVMADDALLYAHIGLVFGHEITHGFDDQGSKYDAEGNLRSWWTSGDSVKFTEKARAIVRQFDAYTVDGGLHLNGSLTQGENIADLGGVTMAHEAFKRTRQYRKNEIIAGLTPDQRFFLGYGLTWMVQMRPESVAAQVKSNEHSPARFRVNGPLADVPAFYAAFDVKEGDAMWRPDSSRISIW
jgi:putative endopeptidase